MAVPVRRDLLVRQQQLIRRIAVLGLLAAALVGCAPVGPPLYEQPSFQTLPWADKSFAQIMARCRHTSLHYSNKEHGYRISRPLYKACMEHYGYHYLGDPEIDDSDHALLRDHNAPGNPTVLTPEQSPTPSKAALYQ
jgi:hypothetical protein